MPHRPPNWKTLAPPPLQGTKTFAQQQNLPKLPVPDLVNTVTRLKASLKPFARSPDEYQAAEKRVDEFHNGLGKTLHERLLKRREETAHWLEDWWDNGAYLGYRDSVVVNVSYYYGFDDQPAHLPQTASFRAACLTRSVMLFRQKLKQGLLAPDATKEGPICMDTWRWMFDCCRVPGEGLDWSVTHAKEGDLGHSGHVIVLRKGRVWKIDAAVDGRLLSTSEFEKQLQHIYDNTTDKYPGVGVLTASNRDVWAKDYLELASDSHNASILTQIHSSAFVLCLDTHTPTSPIDFSRALWHGAAGDKDRIAGAMGNRWVDKPVQLVVLDNAKAGIMGEHSVMDGTPTARICDEVLDALFDPSFDHGSGSSVLTPTPLDWHISPATEQAISIAQQAVDELAGGQTMGYFLTSYGKAAIKAFGVSPDFWAQMIVQLAYRRLTGTNGATYEAASTRKFFKGRTEAIRVVTTETEAWVRSMDDAEVNDEKRKELFGVAGKKHGQLARAAGNGEGVDRHLFGLKKLINPSAEEIPAIYSDPLFLRSSHWVLSTSAIFSKHFPVYGWGEVVPDGFGVAYMTGYDDRLQYTITSRKEMPNARFCEELQKAADDIYKLFSSKSRL